MFFPRVARGGDGDVRLLEQGERRGRAKRGEPPHPPPPRPLPRRSATAPSPSSRAPRPPSRAPRTSSLAPRPSSPLGASAGATCDARQAGSALAATATAAKVTATTT